MSKAEPKTLITVENLSKEFRSLKRREGLKGAFQDLFSRNYQTVKAVDGISFSIKEGEIVGFVGPNGAGKSSTIKMLTGVLMPSSGVVRVNGLDPYKHRARNAQNIGVVFGQRTQLWWDLPAIESFKVLAEIYGISKAEFETTMDTFNAIVDIKELYGKQVRTMSLGQRMLCDIVAAFLHNPRTIFLDEPTIGLDVSIKAKIRSLIRGLNQQRQVTIILTTHDIADIEALCERIIIIDKGKLIYDGPLAKVSSLVGAVRTLRFSTGQEPDSGVVPKLQAFLATRFPQLDTIQAEQDENGWISLIVQEDKITLMEILNAISQEFPVRDIKVEEVATEHVVKLIYEGALK